MIKLTKQQIEAKSHIRPAGYAEDVLSHGRAEGDAVYLDEADWARLRAKYQPAAETVLNYGEIEIAKKRFEICKGCEHSRDDGFACNLHKSCCFGRYRSNPANECLADPPRWEAVKGKSKNDNSKSHNVETTQ